MILWHILAALPPGSIVVVCVAVVMLTVIKSTERFLLMTQLAKYTPQQRRDLIEFFKTHRK